MERQSTRNLNAFRGEWLIFMNVMMEDKDKGVSSSKDELARPKSRELLPTSGISVILNQGIKVVPNILFGY